MQLKQLQEWVDKMVTYPTGWSSKDYNKLTSGQKSSVQSYYGGQATAKTDEGRKGSTKKKPRGQQVPKSVQDAGPYRQTLDAQGKLVSYGQTTDKHGNLLDTSIQSFTVQEGDPREQMERTYFGRRAQEMAASTGGQQMVSQGQARAMTTSDIERIKTMSPQERANDPQMSKSMDEITRLQITNPEIFEDTGTPMTAEEWNMAKGMEEGEGIQEGIMQETSHANLPPVETQMKQDMEATGEYPQGWIERIFKEGPLKQFLFGTEWMREAHEAGTPIVMGYGPPITPAGNYGQYGRVGKGVNTGAKTDNALKGLGRTGAEGTGKIENAARITRTMEETGAWSQRAFNVYQKANPQVMKLFTTKVPKISIGAHPLAKLFGAGVAISGLVTWSEWAAVDNALAVASISANQLEDDVTFTGLNPSTALYELQGLKSRVRPALSYVNTVGRVNPSRIFTGKTFIIAANEAWANLERVEKKLIAMGA